MMNIGNLHSKFEELFDVSVNKNKFTNSIMNRGAWTPVPNEIWEKPITHKAIVVFLYLLSQAEDWQPSIKCIAKGCDCNRKTVMFALEELVAAKMVTITVQGLGLRNEYMLHSVKDWNFDEFYITHAQK
jgi:hypothetical protein